MAVSYQLVIDCTSPERLALSGLRRCTTSSHLRRSRFDSWDDFFRSIGVPEDELGGGIDRIDDPER